jgi:hypothetical protein
MWRSEVPAEVEEASKEVKRIGTVALIEGVILLILAIYIVVMIYLNPAIPYLGLPLVAITLFLVMAIAAIYAAMTIPSSVQKSWAAGQYRESDKQLRGMLVVACLGGIFPGYFAYRAISCLDPVTERTPPPSPQFSGTACSRCSAPLGAGDRFCKVCGAPSVPSSPPPQT